LKQHFGGSFSDADSFLEFKFSNFYAISSNFFDNPIFSFTDNINISKGFGQRRFSVFKNHSHFLTINSHCGKAATFLLQFIVFLQPIPPHEEDVEKRWLF